MLWAYIYLFWYVCHQIEYRIKWENYSHHKNTWERAGNLTNCPDALEDFEKKWAKDIIGMVGNEFKLRFKCGEIRKVSFAEAKSKWPCLLISFCQKCLSWVSSSNNTVAKEAITECENEIANPDEIICKFIRWFFVEFLQ